MSPAASRVREDLLLLRAWIEHWQADRECGLAPTDTSLARAHEAAGRALRNLNLVDAEQREHA